MCRHQERGTDAAAPDSDPAPLLLAALRSAPPQLDLLPPSSSSPPRSTFADPPAPTAARAQSGQAAGAAHVSIADRVEVANDGEEVPPGSWSPPSPLHTRPAHSISALSCRCHRSAWDANGKGQNATCQNTQKQKTAEQSRRNKKETTKPTMRTEILWRRSVVAQNFGGVGS
eukprot:2067547-Rhodomonas_salina.1